MRKLSVLLVTALLWAGPANAQEPCIGPAELVEFYQDPPTPLPSAAMYGVLEGLSAKTFMLANGGAVLELYVEVVYFIHAPVERPGKAVAVLADEAGCAILVSGERTISPDKHASRSFPLWVVDQALIAPENAPEPEGV